jgi:hypothetical protein
MDHSRRRSTTIPPAALTKTLSLCNFASLTPRPDVAGQTATSSHEEAAPANQLSRLAEDLKGMVEKFKYV